MAHCSNGNAQRIEGPEIGVIFEFDCAPSGDAQRFSSFCVATNHAPQPGGAGCAVLCLDISAHSTMLDPGCLRSPPQGAHTQRPGSGDIAGCAAVQDRTGGPSSVFGSRSTSCPFTHHEHNAAENGRTPALG